MVETKTLRGKTVLVTGANRGLGAALVADVLRRGAAKVYCGARDVAKFGDTLERHGGKAEPIQLDVTSDADVAAAAARLPDLDVLISNAGVTYIVPLLETTIDGARATMEANYFGPLRLIKAFGPALNARRGGLIYILSLAALVSARDAELYSASKAAGIMLGHAAKRVLSDLAVSLCYPGLMDTDMMRQAPLPKTPAAEIAARTLDGWAAGETAIFPDLHAEYVRQEFVARPGDILNDIFAPGQTALDRYLAERA